MFNGMSPTEKRHEHCRHQRKGSLKMTSEFISICILVCERHFVKFIVAPAEADMQVSHTADGGIPVCRDSDNIARYGISVGVNPKTNVGLGVPRAGTSSQKAMRNEKAFTKRLNLPPS